MYFLKRALRKYKEIWISLGAILSFLAVELLTRETLLERHLLNSRRFALVEDYVLEIVVIFLILSGGILSYREKKRRQKNEVRILKAILATLNHEMNNPLTVILGNISLLLKSENKLVAENKAIIHRIDSASQRIRDLILELSQIEHIELATYLHNDKMIDRAKSFGRPDKDFLETRAREKAHFKPNHT